MSLPSHVVLRHGTCDLRILTTGSLLRATIANSLEPEVVRQQPLTLTGEDIIMLNEIREVMLIFISPSVAQSLTARSEAIKVLLLLHQGHFVAQQNVTIEVGDDHGIIHIRA